MEGKEVDDTLSITVMHVVTAGKLWVSEPAGLNMSQQRSILLNLEEKLTHLMAHTFEMPSNLPVNQLIAVKNEKTGRWHRGELLSPRPTTSDCRVRVFLVDHGAILFDVQPKHLQILPEEMHELPNQAFITCLYGLIPIAMNVHLEDTHDKMHYEECINWTPASEDLVRACVNYSTAARMRGITCRGHVVYGEIFLDIPGKGFISLNKELIKNNFAIYSVTKYERVMERETELEERMIKKKLEAKEAEEKCLVPSKSVVEVKPILMEDFLKMYTNKKMLRKGNTTKFLDAVRNKEEMESFKVDDERTREELKNAISASKANTFGRGDNLKLMKEEIPVISLGRGLPLPMEQKKTFSPPREVPQKNSRPSFNLFDLLSKKIQKNSEEVIQEKKVDSSVISLGQIPAGHSTDFDTTLKGMKGVKKKSSSYSNSSFPGVVKSSPKEFYQQRKGSTPVTKSLRYFDSDKEKKSVFKDLCSDEVFGSLDDAACGVLDPEFLLKSKSLKAQIENVFSENKEKEVLPEKTSDKVSSLAKVSKKSSHCNKILNLIKLNQTNISHEEKPNVIAKREVDLEISASSLHSDPGIRKPCSDTFFPKRTNYHSVELSCQSNEPSGSKKEIIQGFKSSISEEETENVAETMKTKITSPLHSLLEVFRKKSKKNQQVSSSVLSLSESVPKLKGVTSFAHNNVNQPLPMESVSKDLELQKVKSLMSQAGSISINEEKLEDSNLSTDNKTKDRMNPKKVMVESCLDASSNPDDLKAAFDLISRVISNMENKDSEKPLVDLTILKKELDTFSQLVIEHKSTKIPVVEDETPFLNENQNSEHKIESDFVHNNEGFIDKNKDLLNKQSSTDHRGIMMSTIVKMKKREVHFDSQNRNIVDIQQDSHNNSCVRLTSNTKPSDSSEVSCGMVTAEESYSKETQDELKRKLKSSAVPKHNEVNIDALKEKLESDEFPDCSTKIDETIPKANKDFALLSLFSKRKHASEESCYDKKTVIPNKEKSSILEYKASHHSSDGHLAGEMTTEEKPSISIGTLLNSKEEGIKFKIKDKEENVETYVKDANEHSDYISESNDKSKLSAPFEQILPETKSLLDDERVSRNISSCSKILLEMEQSEKNKCLQIIKDEGVSMVNLSARLPLLAAQNIVKSKGSTSLLNSTMSSIQADSNSSSAVKNSLSKQKILEPEVVTPSIYEENLPLLLRNSWLSGHSSDDCLFTHKRLKMCRVLVRGCFLAQRITSIPQATFPKPLHQALASMGFRDPTRIQTYAWPALMRGQDLVMVNPPRSGKTLAYLVPLVGFMLSPDLYSELPEGNGPLVLIICPSWKVVSQINEFCHCLLSNINACVKVVPTYGGIEAEQTYSLINGCHILISTPRCFLRLLKQDRITTSLDRLCHLVFDDADMLMKLFFPEVKEILSECRQIIHQRARVSAESNPEGAASYAMVKLVAASKSWCPQMESFVTNIIDKPVVFIGSYLEAAVYAQLKPKLHLVGFGVKKEGSEQGKVHSSSENVEIYDVVLHIIRRRLGLYRIVIACGREIEVLQLAPKIRELGAHVLVVHENILHVDIAEALNTWMYSQPGAYPVLIVSDGALPEVSIGDAEHLIHVGIPSSSKTQFGLRFSTLMDNYRDIFDKKPESSKNKKNCFVDIVVDVNEPDAEISGLIVFLQRLGMEIPIELKTAATRSLLNKESMKKKDVDLCPELKSFGECSLSFCDFRHVISTDLDKPKDVPCSGEVRVKVLHVLDASHMSVRLLEHTDHNGAKTIYPNDYYYLGSELARHFGKPENQVAHGTPKVGDLCAFEREINLFHRARVEKVFYSDSKIKIPVGVSINLIDMGINMNIRAFQLYHLPDKLKEYPVQAKELIVANMLPRDLDSSWSKAACVKVAEWIEEGAQGESDGKLIIGNIVLALGNTIWVDSLECREWLVNNKTNVIYMSLPLNLCQVGLAIGNPEHVKKIKQICEVAGMPLTPNTSPLEEEMATSVAAISEPGKPESKLESEDAVILPKWETLDCDQLVEVCVSDVETPSCFRVQKMPSEEWMKYLAEEIQLWISDVWQKSPSSSNDDAKEYCINSLCLGYFSKEKSWNRAKVVGVLKTSPLVVTDYAMESEVPDTEMKKPMQYQLYFLDYGDLVTVSSSEIAPMPENLITLLPFQAIECSLLGIVPLKKESDFESCNDSVEAWDDEAGDALFALCREGDDLDIYRILLAKVFGSEGPGTYGGTRYAVALYDKEGSEGPTSICDLLVKKGVAISCKTVPYNEADCKIADGSEELDSHWLGDGALIPFTPALSTTSELGPIAQSLEDSSFNASVTAKETCPSISDSKILPSDAGEDDDDDDTYDIVMSDDELKLYEESIRSFLGIPPSDLITKTEGQSLAIEDSTGIEGTSSYGRLTPNEGDHSSFTSFEDLGECFQQANDRFEEICDKNNAEDINELDKSVAKYVIIDEETNIPEKHIQERNNESELGVSSESIDIGVELENLSLKSESVLTNKNEENEELVCVPVKIGCGNDEVVREKSSHDKYSQEKVNVDSEVELEALGECFQQANDRFEEICDKNNVEDINELDKSVAKYVIIDEETNISEKHIQQRINESELGVSSEAVDIGMELENLSLKSDSVLTNKNEENEELVCVPVNIGCGNDEVMRQKSSHKYSQEKVNVDSEVELEACRLDEVSLKVEELSIKSDGLSTIQVSVGESMKSENNVDDASLEMLEMDNFNNESDLSPAEEPCGFLKIMVPNDKRERNKADIDVDMDENSLVDALESHFMNSVKDDSLNLEAEVNYCNEHACDDLIPNVTVDDKVKQGGERVSPILGESEAENELKNGEDSADPLQCKYVQLTSKLNEVNRLEEDGTVEAVREYSVMIKEVIVQRIDETCDSGSADNVVEDVAVEKILSNFGEINGCDRESSSIKCVENPNAETTFPSESTAATKNFSDVVEEEMNVSDSKNVDTYSRITEIEDEMFDNSRDESYFSMPCLVRAKTPSVKWGQNRLEIILTIDLPNMNKYNVYWETNSKFKFFALSDTVIDCRYVLEIELWASVYAQDCEHAAVSENSVKMILRKAHAYMEWPCLLLTSAKPLWLSVDFDAIEFDTEEKTEEADLPLVHYRESDEEVVTDEEEAAIEGPRIEEINFDPYDPLS